MKEVIIAFLIALVAGAFINGFAAGGSGPTSNGSTEPGVMGSADSSTASAANVPEVTDQTFDDEVLKANTPVLVDFYGVNCPPCKQMDPVIKQVAGEYAGRVKVVKVDLEQNPRVAMQYNVNTMPTYIVFKGGQRGDAYTGLVPKGILAETLNKALQ